MLQKAATGEAESTNGRPREEAEGQWGLQPRDQQAPAPEGTSSVGQKLPPAPHPTLASWPLPLKVPPGEVRDWLQVDAAGEGLVQQRGAS